MNIRRDAPIEAISSDVLPPVAIANIALGEHGSIDYTELPEDTSNNPIAREWNFYRREVGRLLADGHEGKWVVIKGDEVVGIWATRAEAKQVAVDSFLMQPVLIHEVLRREPILRGPTVLRQCRS